MKKTNIKSNIILLVFALVFFVGTTYAWFVMTQTNIVDDLVINMGGLTGEAYLYIGNDENRDGVLEEIDGKTYTLTDQNESVLTFDKCIPGDVFTFRLEIKNTSPSQNVYYSLRFNAEEILRYFEELDPTLLDHIFISFDDKTNLKMSTFLSKSGNDGYLRNTLIGSNETITVDFIIKIDVNLNNTGINKQLRFTPLVLQFYEK